jgi:hypothetical protein
MLLSPDRGRGWERGAGVFRHLPIRDAVPRKMRIWRVNLTEHRPLSPPLPLSGERSVMSSDFSPGSPAV